MDFIRFIKEQLFGNVAQFRVGEANNVCFFLMRVLEEIGGMEQRLRQIVPSCRAACGQSTPLTSSVRQMA